MLIDNGFRLQFANGMGWRICSTEGAQAWTKKFIEVMSLKPWDSESLPFYCFHYNEFNTKFMSDPEWFPQKIGPITVYSNPQTLDLICDIGPQVSFQNTIYSMWYSLYPLHRPLLNQGAIPIHSGLVEWKGKGILFSASGGTGKTTTINRLPQDWKILCDDEVLIMKDGYNRYVAHPMPTWSNLLLDKPPKSWAVEGNIPVSAIFFLKQSDRDEVIAIDSGIGTVLINQVSSQILRRSWKLDELSKQLEMKKKLFDLSCELAKELPCLILHISLKGKFWRGIEAVLT
jgi:SynChlorMet cassette protein ScmC